jgi:hypothetical protein
MKFGYFSRSPRKSKSLCLRRPDAANRQYLRRATLQRCGNFWDLGVQPHVHLVGQAWLIEPVTIQDLIDVERRWSAASGRAHELEQQLIGLGLVPIAPGPG